MQIELFIDGEKKTFTSPFTPFLAKRKYLEIMANAEKREDTPPYEEQLKEDLELFSILSDVVFKDKFTLDQLYAGVSQEYAYEKLREAIFGTKPKEDDEGNQKGE